MLDVNNYAGGYSDQTRMLLCYVLTRGSQSRGDERVGGTGFEPVTLWV
jgi:hypothetical protein